VNTTDSFFPRDEILFLSLTHFSKVRGRAVFHFGRCSSENQRVKMAIKATYCKLYQEQILGTDKTLNAFGVCPKCFWDIADHDHDRAPQGDFISCCSTISCISLSIAYFP
jgi:hypothetical protein